MHIGVLGWLGAPNLGDEAAYDLLVAGIQARLPGASFVRLTPFTVARDAFPLRVIPSQGLGAFCDALVLGPGGMFPGGLSWLGVLCNSLGSVPLYAASVGWSPSIATPQAERDTAWWLRRFAFVWARDETFGNLAAQAEVPCVVAPDVVYSAQPAPEERDPLAVAIMPNSTRPDLRPAFAALVARLVAEGRRPVLLPASGLAEQDDIAECKALAVEGTVLRGLWPWQDVAREVARCSACYSARKHGAVLAEVSGVSSAAVDVTGGLAGLLGVSGGYTRLTDDPEGCAPAEASPAWPDALQCVRGRVAGALDKLCGALSGEALLDSIPEQQAVVAARRDV